MIKYLDEIKEDFEVYGELENRSDAFREDIAYEVFLENLKDN